jgi:tight adherence protein C
MNIIIIILTMVAVTSFVIGYLYNINREQIITRERLRTYTVTEEKAYLPPDLQLSFRTRVIDRTLGNLSNLIRRFVPKNEKEAYNAKLRTAGNPYGLTGESFLVLKYLVFTISIIIGILTKNLFYLLCLAGAGLFLPDFILKSLVRKREEEILKELPNFLDLLSISVQAGLGFDSALLKVAEKTPGQLSREFMKALQEMGMGKPRREALRDMGERLNINEVTIFTSAIIQAELLGVSISNVLQIQSQQARENRRMQAEEKAMKVPIKMLIPLVVFIFPVIFIVLLGPSVIKLMETL